MPTRRHGVARLARSATLAVVAAVALFCALLLAIRFVVYPRIESHEADIAAMLSREVGAPVEIDAISTGWDGWSPRLVVHGLRVRDAHDPSAAPVIELPSAAGVVSWTSLFTADLRLKELAIEGARLAFRRDREGRLHVGGFAFDESGSDTRDTRMTDWLLRQRTIVVRRALIAWTDEFRNAPQLLLDNVDFRLESSLGRHRFGLRGTPPAEVSSPIDVRGELVGTSFADWKQASGRVYLRLDYADMAAWSEWLPVATPIERGEGALRLWSTFTDGAPVEAIADVELANVRAQLAPDLAPLDLGRLSGRMTWRRDAAHDALAMHGLTLAERGGSALAPIDVALEYRRAADGTVNGGRLTVTRVDIGVLSSLAAQVPLPVRIREGIAAHQPRGELADLDYRWQGPWQTPSEFRAQASVAAAAARAHGDVPGFSGWSGRIDANERGGSAEFVARGASLAMPRVFAHPIAIANADGQLRWEQNNGQWRIEVAKLAFANADAAGSARGWWQAKPNSPGEVDIEARITRADGRQVYRYLPHALGSDVRDWLRDSLLAGTGSDGHVVLKGDLERFPFTDGKSGTFSITARATGATVDYADGWPRVEDVDGELRFDRNRMTIAANRGRIAGATIPRATATIEDLLAEHPVLAIDGEASGATPRFLAFVRTTPVNDWIGRASDGIVASGNGNLALKLELALDRPDALARVDGRYQLVDNDIRLPGVPTMSRVNGTLAFSERAVEAKDVTVETLGGAAKVSFTAGDGSLHATAAGNAALADVHRAFDTPLSSRFTGSSDWRLAYDRTAQTTAWRVESSLRGIAVDLPAPFAKAAADEVALRVERRPAAHEATRDTIVVQYGSRARAVAQRRVAPSGTEVERALLLLGKSAGTAGEPDRAGIVIRGDAPAIDVDAWLDVSRSLETPGSGPRGSGAELDVVEIAAGELAALGRVFDDMKLTAQRSGQRWRFAFRSLQADGEADWEPAGSKLANGRIAARLSRLDYAAMREPEAAAVAGAARREGSANPWPQIDVRAERLIGRAGHLGRMELAAQPSGSDWNITRFALVNDAGRIDAKGTWRLVGRNEHTDLDVAIDVQNTSAFLKQFGLPGDVKGAPAKLDGHLGWPGSPGDFSYATLAGGFRVQVGAGQFTKMDPGVGKLLGVLSLQALPRRITLDFRDVFSEGFAFDTIAGSVSIREGVMRTDDLLVSGPSAKVMLSGTVDLEDETQQLVVRVQPSLSTVVSTGAGAAAVALLAANPLVGAAVGAGTLLAQRIMQDPIEQIFSYEYAVRGSWSDPVVERSRAPALQRFGAPGKPPVAAGTPAAKP